MGIDTSQLPPEGQMFVQMVQGMPTDALGMMIALLTEDYNSRGDREPGQWVHRGK